METQAEPGSVRQSTVAQRGLRARSRGPLFVASLVVGLGLTSVAYAQETPPAPTAGTDVSLADIDRARALAKQANRALLKAQSYSEALDFATRAEALYHAPIHLGIISEALIGMGRLAEAVTTLERLVSEPLAANAPEAFRTAQEDGRRRLKELSARVPSLLLVVKGPSASTVKATIDGKPFSLKGDTATRFDPGVHKLHAVAAGYMALDQTITLPAKGGVVMIEVPFDPEGGPGSTGSDTGGALAPAPSRAPLIAAFGVGAVGLIVGGITGGIFLSRASSLKARCPDNQCDSSDQSDAQSIKTMGTISTAAFIVGGVGVVTGGVMLLSQRFGKKSPRKADGPSAFSQGEGFTLGLTPGGVLARGSF
jgi:hypothetical protein